MVGHRRALRRRRIWVWLFTLGLGAFAVAWAALFVSEQQLTTRTIYAATQDDPAPADPLVNPIVTENALPGTDTWKYIQDFNINTLQAYIGATSINAGQSINVYVKTNGGGI